MIEETDLTLADGRTLHCYDSGEAGGLTVFWHHGSPNTGTPRPCASTAQEADGPSARITGDDELSELLAAFDYASAAGMGSRYSYTVSPGVEDRHPSRVAWCYGDPGVAAALFVAARAWLKFERIAHSGIGRATDASVSHVRACPVMPWRRTSGGAFASPHAT